MTWTVERVGFAPIKGTRQLAYPTATLSDTGPVGDRRFCLVDPASRRALRTVQNPALVAVRAQWDDPALSCRYPDGSLISGTVTVTDEAITFDYWGRPVTGRIVHGQWAAAFGRYLGTELVLVACDPGDVVFGDAVTVVCRSSIDALARQLGRPIDPARWRATLVIDDSGGTGNGGTGNGSTGRTSALLPTDAERPGSRPEAGPIEAGWVGHRLRAGSATLAISSAVARCAVIDICPETGRRDGELLKLLGRTAARDETFGDPIFGVQATVAVPGRVRAGDQAVLLP